MTEQEAMNDIIEVTVEALKKTDTEKTNEKNM